MPKVYGVTSPNKVNGVFHPTRVMGVLMNYTPTSVNELVYGLRWDSVNDLYQPITVVSEEVVEGDYSEYPIQEARKRCILAHTTGVKLYDLHPLNSNYKENGSPAKIDGSHGQVMVETPKFHYLIFTEGDYKYFLNSLVSFTVNKPVAGTPLNSSVHPWFIVGATEYNHQYEGAFEGVLKRGIYVDHNGSYFTATQGSFSGDLIHSVAGYRPLRNSSLTARRTYSVDGVYHQQGFWSHEATILLYLTRYKHWDSQTMLPGFTSVTSTTNYICRTGITASLGNRCGSILWENANASLRCTDTFIGEVIANTFYGKENFFGHLFEWVDGFCVDYKDGSAWVSNNPSDFADGVNWDGGTPVGTPTNYTQLSGVNFLDANVDRSFYQKDLYDGMLLPDEMGVTLADASSTTKITDWLSVPLTNDSLWYSMVVGGTLTSEATYQGRYGVAYRSIVLPNTSSGGGRVGALINQ